MKSALPIILPGRVTKDMAVTATWANSIRDAVYRLAQRRAHPQTAKGGSFVVTGPLELTLIRPRWIAAPDTDPDTGNLRVWLTWGTVNSRAATNLTDFFDVSESKSFFAKATLTTTGPFAVSSWQFDMEDYGFEVPVPDGPRPDTTYYALGSVIFSDDSPPVGVLVNGGSGSLLVYPQIGNSLSGTDADSTIVWLR